MVTILKQFKDRFFIGICISCADRFLFFLKKSFCQDEKDEIGKAEIVSCPDNICVRLNLAPILSESTSSLPSCAGVRTV